MERVCSIFSQVVSLIPRGVFRDAVARHEGEKHAKGMTCWSQLVAMLFRHLGGARSLREITGGLAASEGKLRHLGIERAPTRSTLAYANEHRSWKIYEDVFAQSGVIRARSLRQLLEFARGVPVLPTCPSQRITLRWRSMASVSSGVMRTHPRSSQIYGRCKSKLNDLRYCCIDSASAD